MYKGLLHKGVVGEHYSKSCMDKDGILHRSYIVIATLGGPSPDNVKIRNDNSPHHVSHECWDIIKVLGVMLEFIIRHNRENTGNIEYFHNPIETDYLWSIEISGISELSLIIQDTFTVYNEYGCIQPLIIFCSPGVQEEIPQ